MSPPVLDLRNLELNVGTLCNNRCRFCSSGEVPGARRWLPLERAREEIRRHYEQGCRALGFLGGEPTVYPHLLDCIRFARSLGYQRVTLCSNGTRLSDAAFVESLLAAGVTRLTLSLHSQQAPVEDRLTGVPGNWERKLRGLRLLLEHRAQGRIPHGVSLNPVLSRRTLDGMEGYIEFFRGLGVADIRFNYIWPISRAEHDRGMVPAYREAMPEILRILMLNEKRFQIHLSLGGVPRCMLRWGGVRLSGRLAAAIARKYLCEAEDLPTEVFANEERFNWQARKHDHYKTRAPACARCLYAPTCDGVWRTYAALYGLEELAAVEG